MSRKLVLLDLLLLGLAVLLGWRTWQIHLEGERRLVELRQQAAPKPSQETKPKPAPVEPAPVRAADYLDIASRFLFSPDRNPVVVVKVEAKPMPPLPVAHGVVDLGGGPRVILSEKEGGTQRAYRVGDRIGEFRIAKISRQQIAFEWNGQLIQRKLEELVAKTAEVEQAPAAPASPPPAQPAQATVQATAVRPGPSSIDLGGGIKACQPGDTSPPGTVVNGYRKVVTQTPFGAACRWEPVQ